MGVTGGPRRRRHGDALCSSFCGRTAKPVKPTSGTAVRPQKSREPRCPVYRVASARGGSTTAISSKNESTATAAFLRGIRSTVEQLNGSAVPAEDVAACSGAAVWLEIRKIGRPTSADL